MLKDEYVQTTFLLIDYMPNFLRNPRAKLKHKFCTNSQKQLEKIIEKELFETINKIIDTPIMIFFFMPYKCGRALTLRGLHLWCLILMGANLFSD